MIDRLSREQTPRISAAFASAGARARFQESARALEAPESWAAWMEAEGRFSTAGEGGHLTIAAISSIWPPRD